MPKNLPNFARRPDRVSGIPVVREILRFAAVIPNARFQENVSPGPNFMPLTVSVRPESPHRRWATAKGKWGTYNSLNSDGGINDTRVSRCLDRQLNESH